MFDHIIRNPPAKSKWNALCIFSVKAEEAPGNSGARTRHIPGKSRAGDPKEGNPALGAGARAARMQES